MSSKKKAETTDEVEELLRAAQDETLLRLSLNSHAVRGSSAHSIHPDLDRRFQALKSRPKTSAAIPNKIHNRSTPTASSSPPDELKDPRKVAADDDGEDDLFARFTALKSSLPSHSSSVGSGNDSRRLELENSGEEDGDDEVEKLIKWAVDAARLDPSPPSDSDTDDDVDDRDGSDEDEDSDGARRKAKQK